MVYMCIVCGETEIKRRKGERKEGKAENGNNW